MVQNVSAYVRIDQVNKVESG